MTCDAEGVYARQMGMRGQQRIVLAVAASGLLGCGGEEPRREVAGCHIEEEAPIAADDAPLGFSARDVVESPVEGGLVLQYGLERDPGPSVGFEVGIESADFSKIYWIRKSYRHVGDFTEPCPAALTFPATVLLRTADGQIDERLHVDVWATAADAHRWRLEVPLEELSESFVPEWPLPWSGTSLASEADPKSAYVEAGFAGSGTGSWGWIGIQALYRDSPGGRVDTLARWGERPQGW